MQILQKNSEKSQNVLNTKHKIFIFLRTRKTGIRNKKYIFSEQNYKIAVLFFYEKKYSESCKNIFKSEFGPAHAARDVIRRLCNKDRDQGPKGVGVIDHVVTYSTLDK